MEHNQPYEGAPARKPLENWHPPKKEEKVPEIPKIAILNDYDLQALESKVNKWMEENYKFIDIEDIRFQEYKSHYSVLIFYYV